jgi:hypothetical protein
MGWCWSAWPGCGAEPVEGLGEVGGPGPVLTQPQGQASFGADEPAGDVQGAVAQPFGFDLAERDGEAQGLGQVVRSAAVIESSTQAALVWRAWQGRFRRPRSLPLRIRSSTRAC